MRGWGTPRRGSNGGRHYLRQLDQVLKLQPFISHPGNISLGIGANYRLSKVGNSPQNVLTLKNYWKGVQVFKTPWPRDHHVGEGLPAFVVMVNLDHEVTAARA